MSEKYYREINTNKDIVKFEFQLGAILLKLNEHNQNIKDLDTDIKNNDKDNKANYDICASNNNTLIDIDRKIYALNNNITNINNDIVNIKEKKLLNIIIVLKIYGYIILTYLIHIQSLRQNFFIRILYRR